MDERWITLLNFWQRNEFHHSLTFPFLIGALRVPVGSGVCTASGGREELENLIDVMRSHVADGYFHHIYRCPELGQLVVTRISGSIPPATAIAVDPSRSSSEPSLFASDGIDPNSSSPFDSLVTNIWSETGTAIENRLFSCRGKTFGEFNEYELGVIQKALA